MFRPLTLLTIAFSVLSSGGMDEVLAEEAHVDRSKMTREIYVPFEDLSILLENQPRRVLLSGEEYAELLARAKGKTESRPPREAAIIAAGYEATLESERAVITGTLVVDVLEDGLHRLGLDLAGVGLRRATLDGQGASIGRADDGRLMLFAEGKGQHHLLLDMVAPLETAAARQSLNFRVPTPAATRMQLTVPGDVEVKSGAHVVSRFVDEAAQVTRFELLPKHDRVSLVMTLNRRFQRRERLVEARGVVIDEVTEAYEKLHATYSMAVLHKAVDHFRFAVPEGFEITQVKSPLLASWRINQEGQGKILDIRLREQTTETVVLNLSAVRPTTSLKAWTLPQFAPLDVVGQATVIGLLIEDRLTAESIVAEGLIPVDTAVLTRVLPASIFQAEAGAPRIRPVLAYYAPHARFSLAAQFKKPSPRLLVSTFLRLLLKEKNQLVHGGFTLLPEVEDLFEFDLLVPAGWQVTSITAEDDSVLTFERYGNPNQESRIHLRLPEGVKGGQQFRMFFQASRIPVGWLADWKSMSVTFPVFAIADATREVGAITVEAYDDLRVRPEKLEQLRPLDDKEKDDYGLSGVTTNLAYRFEGHAYQAELAVERIIPRATARTYSFFKVDRDVLAAHYEIVFDVEEARTHRLALLLPEGTPAALSIRGLDGLTLKEYSSEMVNGMRRWTVLLGEGRRDTIRLAIDFQQSLHDQEPQEWVLPMVQAASVAYQSGMVAVEGCPELDVQINTTLRKVDVGELAEAEYQTRKRLLGAYAFVGDSPEIKISIFRHLGYQLPPVIVQQAELVTLLSANGLSQTAARYRLRTKAQYLEVKLPPGSTLWSAELDGMPAKPQRENQKLLLSLPTSEEGVVRDLRIVYETPVDPVSFLAEVNTPAPRLLFRASSDAQASELPVADLRWHVYLPTGYRVVRTGGTVVTEQVPPPELAITSVGKFLYRICGGVNLFYGGFMLARARKFAPPTVQYGYHSSTGEVSDLEELNGLFDATRTGRPEDQKPQKPKKKKASRRRPRKPRPPSEEPAGSISILEGEPASVADTPPATKPVEDKYWALQGVRSLKIDLEQTGQQITFHSLGEEPRLAITLTHHRRFEALAWGLGLAVCLAGLVLTKRPARSKAMFIVVVALIATFFPLIMGSAVLTYVLNIPFYAACLLVPYYLLARFVGWLSPGARGLPAATAAAIVIASVLGNVPAASAAEPDDKASSFIIQVVEPPKPVTVPKDAIIIPYDPQSKTGIQDVGQLLVPYDKFVELWNRAYPERKLETKQPPAPFALSGAAFSAILQGDEYLLIEGHLDIEVYTDDYAVIPLPLEGGVLARADLDGQPARLGFAQTVPHPIEPVNIKAQAEQAVRKTADPLLVLYVSGKGQHRLDLAMRMRLHRRGGWRVAEGRLPAATASALNLRVPGALTEVRLSKTTDRRYYLTKRSNESIETVLGSEGAMTIQWRPKISEGVVDQSVTAKSDAILDVQEDGLRLVWQLELQFRNNEREFFRIQVPRDYLVVKVAGDNVRGWEARPNEQVQELEVTLLKPAKERERFTVHLKKPGQVGQENLTEFEAPVVGVSGAALHHGKLTIHRSPLLDLRTVGTSGVTRTDPTKAAEDGLAGGELNPLGIRPFQAFRFAATPFTVRLTASPVLARTRANVQMILRIAERERSLEARVNLEVQSRRLYHLRLLLPGDLDLEQVSAPGEFEWALTRQNEEQLLNIYFATGQIGQVPIHIRGTLGQQGIVNKVPLPRLEVLDVERQQGDIVAQVDPAFDVRATELQGCETILLKRVYGWLNARQRLFARTALHYRSPAYSGELQLTYRQPIITCYTVTNVRVTDRAVEETILLDFSIRSAGIRELSFLLPERMKDSRISVPMLRQKTVEPVMGPPVAMVRVRLELQDKVMGGPRVLVENDRLLTPELHEAPIPVVELGRTDQRYVVLESAGRNEVVVEKLAGLVTLSRQQKEWRTLTDILGEGITQAYVAGAEGEEPLLSFKVKDREIVETVGARIGLAQTLLVLDANGTYRATQIYRLANSTEQFLQIELPQGADLWTARVAGEPVKPTKVSKPAKLRRVRIPLVKTAPGDLDYEVMLKYGGKLQSLDRVSTVTFPLIRTVNINAELSQVRLYLPETHSWFDFDGTMRLVTGESELAAGYISYQTKLAERLSQTLSGADSFAQVRAASSLKRLKSDISDYHGKARSYSANKRLQLEWASNAVVLRNAEQQLRAVEQTLKQEGELDNRNNLGEFYDRQQATRARDVVKDLDDNFGDLVQQPAGATDTGAEQFDDKWFAGNKLLSTPVSKQEEDRQRISGLLDEVRIAGGGGSGGRGHQSYREMEAQIDQSEMMRALQEDKDEVTKPQRKRGTRRRREDAQNIVQQYQKELEKSVEEKLTLGIPESGEDVTTFDFKLSELGVVALPTGLSSLDVEIPQRGTVYRFTTPRGEVEISARAASRPFIVNFVQLVTVAVVALVVWRVYRFVHLAGLAEMNLRIVSTVLLVGGIVSVLTGALPVAGVIAIITAITTRIHQAKSARQSPQCQPFT